jgi:hypothetical protein
MIPSYFFSTILPLKSDCQIFSALKDLTHTLMHKFLLLDQFLGFRILSKFDCFYETMLEFFGETMGRFHFDVGIPYANQVSDELDTK